MTILALLAVLPGAVAQTAPVPANSAPVPVNPAGQAVNPAPTEADRAARETELRALEDKLRNNEEARTKLAAEIDQIKSDRAKLNAALIESAQRVRDAENRVAAADQRLATLNGSAGAIRQSLDGRRAVIAEVLAALQRMGRHPPPAVLVKPEDILSAVRTSILLGAVVPELRGEAEILAQDLAELVRLGDAIKAEKAGLEKDLATYVSDRERLASLIEARQQRLASAEKSVADETAQAGDLAKQAQTLKDLLKRMDETEANRKAQAAQPALDPADQAARERLASLAFKDPARLAPKIAFVDAKGLLPLPVSGTPVRPFGAADGFGGKSQGVSLATRPAALVSSPCDGWVAFAGPFRSFGQLLIINAGGGYYVLLAGMERINVAVGQFVLAGEPVAVMGEVASPSSTALGGTANGPVLYIEFRKDGGSIDPSPWWAKSQVDKLGEKVRG